MVPLISIITVTFNASEVIDATLESIACQDCQDFEFIVVDGASTDDTLKKVEGSCISNPKIISEPDKGIYDAMNKGLDLAGGKYVVFLNAGDSFHSYDVISRVRDVVLRYQEPGVIYGQTDIVDINRKFLSKRHLDAPDNLTFESFRNGMLVCHQAFFAKRSLAPYFNTGYRFSSDYEWCLCILQKSPQNKYLGDEPIIDYLNEGITSKNHLSSLKERFMIMSRYYGLFKTSILHARFLYRAIKRKI